MGVACMILSFVFLTFLFLAAWCVFVLDFASVDPLFHISANGQEQSRAFTLFITCYIVLIYSSFIFQLFQMLHANQRWSLPVPKLV